MLSSNGRPRWVDGRMRILVGALVVLLCVACGGGGSDTAPEAKADDGPVELEFWQSVKDSGDADQLLAYIKRYPQGQFVELAESRLKNLRSDTSATVPSGADAEATKNPPPPRPSPPPPASSEPTTSSSRKPSSSVRSEPSSRSRSRSLTARGGTDDVLDVVEDSLDGYRDPRLHVHPNIPRGKANNAASVHGIGARSTLVLYDDGLMGGGKTGFVITKDRVHWRYVSGADVYYADFEDIDSAVPRQSKFELNGYDVGTTMSSNASYAAEVYADLMLDLRAAFR